MAPADAALAARLPRRPGARQPVHTVYVPADRVAPGLRAGYGTAARAALDEHAPDPGALAAVVGADPDRVAEVWPLLLAKLDARAGRGPADRPRGRLPRPPRRRGGRARRRGRARRCAGGDGAAVLGRAVQVASRRATRARGLRTLDLVLGAALEAGPLPDGFRLTLPKVTSVEQVARDGGGLRRGWRRRTGWTPGGCASRSRSRRRRRSSAPTARPPWPGSCTRPRAGAPGCTSAPTTTPPRSGSPPAHQAMDHPAADHAKHVMQAGRRRHRRAGLATARPTCCRSASTEQVHAGWALHFRLVRRSLERGLLPGLGPAPGPAARPGYLATFLFFRVRARRRGRPAARLPRRRRPAARPRRARHRAGAGRLPAPRACTAAR